MRFTEELKSMEVMEGCTATLQCQLSKKASVEWKKGIEILRDGDRYKLRQKGAMRELQIHGLTMSDAGEYSCVCGEEKTTAILTIKGKDHNWLSRSVWCCPNLNIICPSLRGIHFLVVLPRRQEHLQQCPLCLFCVGFMFLDPVSHVLTVIS